MRLNSALGDEVFTGTHAIFNGNNTFVSFGGFLYLIGYKNI